MGLVRMIARPMLASMFVVGGIDQLSKPAGKVPVATDVTDPLREAAGSPQLEKFSNEQLVQVNGAAQVIGGALLALGKAPRLAAALLAGTLVPTTFAAHRFWDEREPEAQEAQQIQFFKNVSLLGGLLIATMDTAGDPGVTWRAQHAVDHAKVASEHAAEVARLKAGLATTRAKKKLTPDIGDAKKLVDAVRS